jgi:hypothetical protein
MTAPSYAVHGATSSTLGSAGSESRNMLLEHDCGAMLNSMLVEGQIVGGHSGRQSVAHSYRKSNTMRKANRSRPHGWIICRKTAARHSFAPNRIQSNSITPQHIRDRWPGMMTVCYSRKCDQTCTLSIKLGSLSNRALLVNGFFGLALYAGNRVVSAVGMKPPHDGRSRVRPPKVSRADWRTSIHRNFFCYQLLTHWFRQYSTRAQYRAQQKPRFMPPWRGGWESC